MEQQCCKVSGMLTITITLFVAYLVCLAAVLAFFKGAYPEDPTMWYTTTDNNTGKVIAIGRTYEESENNALDALDATGETTLNLETKEA